MNMLDEFIKYKCFADKTLKEDKLAGAKQDEIDRLENTVGYPLPDIYKEFLLRLGRTSSKDLFFYRGYLVTEIDSVIAFNEEALKFDSKFMPYSLIIGSVRDEDFDIGLKYSSVEEDPKVVEIDLVEISDLIADSFFKYLFQRTFLHASILFRYAHVFSVSNKEIPKISELLPAYNFEKQWFSDSVNYLGIEKDKNGIVLMEERKVNSGLYIYYNDHSSIEFLIKRIKKSFNAEEIMKEEQKDRGKMNRIHIPNSKILRHAG